MREYSKDPLMPAAAPSGRSSQGRRNCKRTLRICGSIGTKAVFLLLACACWAAQLAKAQGVSFDPVEVVHVAEPHWPPRSVAVGTVILKVVVTKSGTVGHVKAVHAIPLLTAEVERTVKQWKFKPARLDHRAVESSIIVSFGFSTSFTPGRRWTAGFPPTKLSSFSPIQILSTEGAPYPFTSLAAGAAPYVCVILRVTVGRSGSVDDIAVIRGTPSLTEAAEQTVRKWTFRPAKLNGSPVSSETIASFTFRVVGNQEGPI